MTTGPAVTVATPDDAGAEQGLDPMVFTVTRSSTATPTMVALAWERHGDARLRHTVTAAGGTLSAERLWLTFNTGQTTVTVTVIPVDDLFVESAETVTLTVVAGIGYTVGAIVFGTGSIADNDVVAVPEVSVSATSSAGNEQGQIPIVFTVTRTGVTTGTTNVTLAWSGSATLTTDYAVAVSGTAAGSVYRLGVPEPSRAVEPRNAPTLRIAAGASTRLPIMVGLRLGMAGCAA